MKSLILKKVLEMEYKLNIMNLSKLPHIIWITFHVVFMQILFKKPENYFTHQPHPQHIYVYVIEQKWPLL